MIPSAYAADGPTGGGSGKRNPAGSFPRHDARTAPLTAMEALSGDVLRRAFGRFPTGVVGVCAKLGDRLLGLAASSFVSISLDPPLIAFCIKNESGTWPILAQASRLGISVLSANQGMVARSLAAKNVNERFSNLAYTVTPDGAVFVEGASLYFDCSIHQVVSAGDHGIVLLNIHAVAHAESDAAPLVFYASGFRQLSLADS